MGAFDWQPGDIVYHEEFGQGRVVNVEDGRVTVNFRKAGLKFLSAEEADEQLLDTPPEPVNDDDDDDELEEVADLPLEKLKAALRQVLREEGILGETPLAEKWEGGEVILKPGKPGLQEKSIPVDSLFHKVVMVRDRLRVLEQQINGHPKLTDEDKASLQQYITRSYGSLTTFNVLFSDRADWFVGEKKKG